LNIMTSFGIALHRLCSRMANNGIIQGRPLHSHSRLVVVAIMWYQLLQP